ncbi:hypothetical protein BaRGS_00038491 [Batillaria attramentaria]|uniref:N-acetylgalactosaminide beta-1,3-galactosyltransferase n=1 Tax=Batillaria attramentaria TaxID=370345 RepID=A0ABD0J722_9CAEN
MGRFVKNLPFFLAIILSSAALYVYIISPGKTHDFRESAEQSVSLEKKINVDPEPDTEQHTWHDTLSIDDSVARELSTQTRVLCWVPARASDITKSIRAVNETWVRRCDGHLFFVETKQPAWDIVSVGVDGTNRLAEKMYAATVYIYKHHLDQYDWFYRADDNTYAIMENLRLLLSKYDPNQPVYLGQLYQVYTPHGFMAGGGGWLISREALRVLIEEGFEKNKCPPVERHSDDIHIAKCLHAVGVKRHYSLDKFGRESFHQQSAQEVIASKQLTRIMKRLAHFPQQVGRNCCSELTISFHDVDPDQMLVLDHLLYRTSVYGRVQDPAKLKDLFQNKTIPMP